MYENTTACENPGMTALLSSSCGTMTWVSENRTCSLMTYTGQVCKKPLLEWQNCIAGQNSSNVILISTVESQLQLEQQVIQTFEVIGQFNKCTMYLTIVIPLILYTYVLFAIHIPLKFNMILPSTLITIYDHHEKKFQHL